MTYIEEVTYGTAPTSGYKPLEIVRDPDLAPLVVDRLARDTVRPWHGADAQRLINRRVTVSFQIRLGGSGTAGTAPQFGDILVSSAMTQSITGTPADTVTYTPASLSTTPKSCTLRWYADGQLHQVVGTRFTWSLAANAGEFPTLNVEAIGLYVKPTKTSLITDPTYANQAAPLEVNASNTTNVEINNVACCMASFELTLGNALEYESYAGCVEQIAINDRQPEGTIEIESKIIGSGTGEQDFYALFEAGTQVPIEFDHGPTATGFKLEMPTCQLFEPTMSDRNGKLFMSIPFAPIRTAAATPELSLIFA
jgi:hypothetical protein